VLPETSGGPSIVFHQLPFLALFKYPREVIGSPLRRDSVGACLCHIGVADGFVLLVFLNNRVEHTVYHMMLLLFGGDILLPVYAL